MIDSVIIIGVIVVVMKILKLTFPFFETEKGLLYISLLMFLTTGLLNIVNGIAFGGDTLTVTVSLGYFKDGLILGAAASGIYGMGKEVTTSIKRRIRRRYYGRH